MLCCVWQHNLWLEAKSIRFGSVHRGKDEISLTLLCCTVLSRRPPRIFVLFSIAIFRSSFFNIVESVIRCASQSIEWCCNLGSYSHFNEWYGTLKSTISELSLVNDCILLKWFKNKHYRAIHFLVIFSRRFWMEKGICRGLPGIGMQGFTK